MRGAGGGGDEGVHAFAALPALPLVRKDSGTLSIGRPLVRTSGSTQYIFFDVK